MRVLIYWILKRIYQVGKVASVTCSFSTSLSWGMRLRGLGMTGGFIGDGGFEGGSMRGVCMEAPVCGVLASTSFGSCCSGRPPKAFSRAPDLVFSAAASSPSPTKIWLFSRFKSGLRPPGVSICLAVCSRRRLFTSSNSFSISKVDATESWQFGNTFLHRVVHIHMCIHAIFVHAIGMMGIYVPIHVWLHVLTCTYL